MSETARRHAEVEVYNAKDGFRWRLRHNNGNIVAESGEAYVNRATCDRMWRKAAEYLVDAHNE